VFRSRPRPGQPTNPVERGYGTHANTLAPLLRISALCCASFSQTWEIEVVEDGKLFANMTDRSLRLDAQNLPHVAYGADWLYYAWHDGTVWHYEVADSSPQAGRYASLALDSSGYPHVSYCAASRLRQRPVEVRTSRCDRVHCQIVDAEVSAWEYTSIALDASGNPHISYRDSVLKHAYRDTMGWHTEVVDGQGVGKYSSIALDTAGFLHISYYEYTNGDLKYAHQDATAGTFRPWIAKPARGSVPHWR